MLAAAVRQRAAGAAVRHWASRASAGQLGASSAEIVGGQRVRSSGPANCNLDVPLVTGSRVGEELLASSLAASFHSALVAGAQRRGDARLEAALFAGLASVRAQVVLPDSARLEVSLSGLDEAAAQALTEEAARQCAVSNAIRGSIDVEVLIGPPNGGSSSATTSAGGASSSGTASSEEQYNGPPRVLVVGRRPDVVRATLNGCKDMGFEAQGVTSNGEVEDLLQRQVFDACAIGFRYGDSKGQDLQALKSLLEARGIRSISMPPGSNNVRNALQRLGLDSQQFEDNHE